MFRQLMERCKAAEMREEQLNKQIEEQLEKQKELIYSKMKPVKPGVSTFLLLLYACLFDFMIFISTDFGVF